MSDQNGIGTKGAETIQPIESLNTFDKGSKSASAWRFLLASSLSNGY